MKSKHRVKPPASSSAPRMPSMFTNANNTSITDSSFSMTTTIITTNGPPLDILHKRVAPNAILNAGGRADEVRCHPGTREEIIGRIEKWGDAQDDQTPPMFWLSGPAGAGKSAIMQTTAERCKRRGVPHANFFFFRADTSRNAASPLLSTLLHQIILLYPFLRDSVITLLDTNPLIFDSTLEDQLAQLIVTPLLAVQQSSSTFRPLLLLIDGLDECDSETRRSQQQILEAFDKVLAEHPGLFRLLVASRDESQIRAAFNRVSSQCTHLYLDSQYSPEKDIRVFVDAQFAKIRQTHPLAHMVDAIWPSLEDVDNIVNKSSGQFIYAATVMRFIMDSSASPMLSLERVKGAARLASAAKSPFAYLDAIYTYILSQADDQEALKDILHAHLLIVKCRNIRYELPGISAVPDSLLLELLALYNQKHTKAAVLSCLADLTSIALFNSSLLFHHASFPDYLLDYSRSADYFVDIPAFSYKILPVVWARINELQDTRWLEFGLSGISHLEKLPPGLTNTLASSESVWSLFKPQNTTCLPFFAEIHKLCTRDDDIKSLRRIIRQWVYKLSLDDNTLRRINHIPFSSMYFEMACAEQRWVELGEKGAAICPVTDLDREELALWLSSLLHGIHTKIYRRNLKDYRQHMMDWISWALKHDISCDNLRDLPYAQQCIQRNTTKERVGWNFKIGRSKK